MLKDIIYLVVVGFTFGVIRIFSNSKTSQYSKYQTMTFRQAFCSSIFSYLNNLSLLAEISLLILFFPIIASLEKITCWLGTILIFLIIVLSPLLTLEDSLRVHKTFKTSIGVFGLIAFIFNFVNVNLLTNLIKAFHTVAYGGISQKVFDLIVTATFIYDLIILIIFLFRGKKNNKIYERNKTLLLTDNALPINTHIADEEILSLTQAETEKEAPPQDTAIPYTKANYKKEKKAIRKELWEKNKILKKEYRKDKKNNNSNEGLKAAVIILSVALFCSAIVIIFQLIYNEELYTKNNELRIQNEKLTAEIEKLEDTINDQEQIISEYYDTIEPYKFY